MAEENRQDAPRTFGFGNRAVIWLAWLALLWERLWPKLAPPLAVVLVFLVVALFDLLPGLPGWLHTLGLVVFAALVLGAAAFGLVRLAWPQRREALRRVERASGLSHRPLSEAHDRLVIGATDRASSGLWATHQSARASRLRRLRFGWPAAGLSEIDRFGLRGLIGVLVVVAIVAAGPDAGQRLLRAVTPSFAVASAPGTTVTVLIDPPAYTRMAPSFLEAPVAAAPEGPPTPLLVPQHSRVVARVAGIDSAPDLVVGDAVVPFEPLAAGQHEATAEVLAGDRLAIITGRGEMAGWPLEVVPDQPPTISHAQEPQSTPRWTLRLEYAASDDYGIDGTLAEIRLADGAPAALPTEPIQLELLLPSPGAPEATAVSFHDLTPHPWAGQAVTIQLQAVDGAGQRGVSDAVSATLPEREFAHPVAQEIIALRRALILGTASPRIVAESLDDVSSRPDRFYGDAVVFLALRSAADRLRLARDPEAAVASTQRLLWDTALRLEDGDLSLAERELRAAQEELARALSEGASDEEIAQLMQELREALDRYLAALQENLREQLARGEIEPMLPPEGAQLMDEQALSDLLDQMQSLAESGAREAAQEMLQDLQSLLESLQSGQMAPMMAEQRNRTMEMLQDLQNLIGAQQQLMDQTFQDAQSAGEGQPGDAPSQPGAGTQPGQGPGETGRDPGAEGAASAAVQEALRRALGELMLDSSELLGDIPGALGQAERAMRQAGDMLSAGNPGGAVPSQGEAIDALQQGLESLVQQAMEQMAQQGMPQLGRPGQGQQPGRDPLGRPASGSTGLATQGDEVPREVEVQRSREILHELRRRLGDRDLPGYERDYLERLMDLF